MTVKGAHAARRKAEASRAGAYEVAARENNEVHARFFGVPNIPVREIRNRLDPILRAHAVREITKIYIGEKEGDDDAQG